MDADLGGLGRILEAEGGWGVLTLRFRVSRVCEFAGLGLVRIPTEIMTITKEKQYLHPKSSIQNPKVLVRLPEAEAPKMPSIVRLPRLRRVPGSCELSSKLLVSPLITPIVLPSIIPYITPI